MGPHNQLVIISGPSGAGKSTLVRRLVSHCELPLELSVSATTRPPRPGEIAGRDYHFLSLEEFARRRARDEFLECKEVFGRGHWYGTLEEDVRAGWDRGNWVILEIDVEGARSVLQRYPDAITIFVHPGSMDELRRRLIARGTETPESLARRLEVAAVEMEQRHWYRHEIINQIIDTAAEATCRLLLQYNEGKKLCLKS